MLNNIIWIVVAFYVLSLKTVLFSFSKLKLNSKVKQMQRDTGIGVNFRAVYALIWSDRYPPAVLLLAIWQVAVLFWCLYLLDLLGAV